MRVKFLNFIEKHNLVHFGDRVLLAVSGGIDSMVMLNLFHGSGVRFSVAHCNFTLRGHESDGDQEFVSQICQTMGVELFVKRFDTNAYARGNRISIQVAAREFAVLPGLKSCVSKTDLHRLPLPTTGMMLPRPC